MPGLINRRIGAEVIYHDTLHSFRAARGTGKSSLEANLIQNLTVMREGFLYGIFLDIRKAYATLDQGWFLEIIVAY